MPVEIPLWRVALNYDFRQILAWGLENFPPRDTDGDIGDVMRAAIEDKRQEITVDALALRYLDNMGTAAAGTDHAVRIDAWRFLGTLPDPKTKKPDGIVNGKRSEKPVQKGLFD